jgi:hypothetical protein
LGAFGRAFSAMRTKLYSPTGNLTVNGVTTQAWPSPLEPVQPIGPAGSKPLAFSFWQGVNQSITPRLDAPLSFTELRDLGSYPLAWICRENVKDVICGMGWKIQLKRVPGESTKDWKARQAKDKIAVALTEFFKCPDGENPWSDWLRPILEDMLVIDAASILVDRTLSGKVAKLRWTDGADILRIVDDQGYTPEGDGWAYTQLWEGIPRIALSRRQLVYRPSNIVPANTLASKLYGSSITQQLAPELRIGQERLRFVLAYYTDGSVPGLVHVVPPGVNPDKIKEAMQWMNSELAGNLAKRRQWRNVQGWREEGEDQIVQLKEPVLADVFDDLHIRKVCFGYGTSAQRLLKQMNRASAEAGQDSAEKEGTMPRVRWVKSTMDHIIAAQFDQPNYEWLPETDDELDAAKQAEVDKTLISSGQETIDERREARGLIPFGLPETSQPIIITATGVIPVAGSIERTEQAHTAAIATPKPAAPGSSQGGEDDQKPPTKPVGSKKKVAKASEITIQPKRDTGPIRQARDGMRVKVAFWLQRQGRKASEIELAKVAKAANGDDPRDIDEIVDAVMAELDWHSLVDIVEPDLLMAAIEGADIGISDLSITDQDVISAVNEVARDYASNRSAEMVGMKRVDGELVPNPRAEMRIDESTRNMVRQSIKDAFSDETKVSDLAAAIRESGAFSQARADLIAENEVRQAQVRGNLASWEASGVVQEFRWQLSGDHTCCDICDKFAEEGPYPLDQAEQMLDETHVLCACILVATKIKGVEL